MKGRAELILLGRAASRALSSASPSSAAEALFALRTPWRQDFSRRFHHTPSSGASAVGIFNTSSTVGQAPAGLPLGYQGSIWDAATTSCTLWRRGPTAAPLAESAAAVAAIAPSLTGLKALHVSATATAPADKDGGAAAPGGGGSRGGDGGPAASSPPAGGSSAAPPVQNPLQAALAAASGTQPPAAAGAGPDARAVKGRRRERRTWMWYDEDDERAERRSERAREQYTHVGTAYMSNITQSVKKMNRIVRLVRGLSYSDAVAQCKMVPHKAARHVVQALEAAFQDATQAVGLDGERLVVGLIYATRGRVEKAMQRMGRGRSGRMFTRTSHLRVVLRESRERPSGFQMRTVTPLMGVMSGAAAPAAASWLAAGPAAAARVAQRRRFAYRIEV